MSAVQLTVVTGLLIAVILYAGVLWYLRYRGHRVGRMPGEMRRELLRLVPALGTALATIWALMLVVSGREQRSFLEGEFFVDRSASLSQRLDVLEKKFDSLWDWRKGVPFAQSLPAGEAAASAAFVELRQKVEEQSKAIERFEGLFLSEAERLITLPLLQRELEGVRNETAAVKENLRTLSGLVGEMNNQNRWSVGVLALGMLVLVIPVIRSLLPPHMGEPTDVRPAA